MKFVGFRTLIVALLLPPVIAHTGALPAVPKVGDTYEITLTKVSVQRGSNTSSGTSHDKNTIIERVIGLHPDGLESEYDLLPGATAEDRARQWQCPDAIDCLVLANLEDDRGIGLTRIDTSQPWGIKSVVGVAKFVVTGFQIVRSRL